MAVAFRSLFLTKNTSLRGVETANGEQFFSVYDFLNFLTGRERGDEHARSMRSMHSSPSDSASGSNPTSWSAS